MSSLESRANTAEREDESSERVLIEFDDFLWNWKKKRVKNSTIDGWSVVDRTKRSCLPSFHTFSLFLITFFLTRLYFFLFLEMMLVNKLAGKLRGHARSRSSALLIFDDSIALGTFINTANKSSTLNSFSYLRNGVRRNSRTRLTPPNFWLVVVVVLFY